MSYAPRLFLPVLLATVTLAAQPALAETLTQAQISSRIIGKDLRATRNGMTVRLRYNHDGSIAMKVALISGAGTWVYAGNGLCMMMTKGPKRGKTCTAFEDLGNGTYRNSEGLILRVQE